jgi:hypothetical protein
MKKCIDRRRVTNQAIKTGPLAISGPVLSQKIRKKIGDTTKAVFRITW